MSARRYILVLNNYSTSEYEELHNYVKNKKFFIIGKEVGESGTPHLQMYLEHNTPIKFDTLKRLNKRLHIEKAKGDLLHNWNYICENDKKPNPDYITNIPIDFILKKKNKKIPIKNDFLEEITYHLDNHRYIISEDRYMSYITNYDIDNLNEPLKSIIFKDIRLFNESKHCTWCKFVNGIVKE